MGLLGKRKYGGRSTAGAGPRKRRVARRSRAMVPMFRRPKLPTITLNRQWWSTVWTPSTISTTDFWKYFTVRVNQIPNISEYTAIFDLYRINSFVITLRPRYDNFSGNDTTDTTLPGVTNQASQTVHVIIDPKTPTTPGGTYVSSNLNTFLENGKVRSYKGTNVIRIPVKYPCIPDDVNGVAAAKFIRSPFLSTNDLTTTYRGAHVFIQDVNFTGVFGNQYDIFVSVNVTFKGMRS